MNIDINVSNHSRMNIKICARAKTLGRGIGRGKTSLFNLQGHLLYSRKGVNQVKWVKHILIALYKTINDTL